MQSSIRVPVAVSHCMSLASPAVLRHGDSRARSAISPSLTSQGPASFQASSLLHGCMIDVDAPPTNRGINSLTLLSGFPRPPDHTAFLCRQRVGPSPLFDPTGNRRMEWSPFQNPGSSEWIPQWMCVPCNRVVGLAQARDRPHVVCSQCQVLCPTLVVDCFSDAQWRWCARCQRREEITSQDAPRSVVPIGFFTAPLSTMGRLFGWGESPISPPGSGSQSWLFFPLISLALAADDRERNVPLYPTGSRLPSRTCNVISGIRRRLRSFNCTVISSSL